MSKTKPEKLIQMPVYLTEEDHEALRQLAFDTRQTMSHHVRVAVSNYLKQMRKKTTKT